MQDIRNFGINKSFIVTLSVLGLIFMILKIGNYYFMPFFSRFISVQEAVEMGQMTILMGTIQNILLAGFNIAVGFILMFKAKQINQSRLVWLVIGLFFGINGILLFLVFSIKQTSPIINIEENQLLDR